MLNLKNIFDTIKEKNNYDFKCLTLRLTNKNIIDFKPQQFLDSIKSKKYLNTQFEDPRPPLKKSTDMQSRSRIRRRQNASEHTLYKSKKLRPIRNNSSNMHESQDKQLQLKRQRLMLELKEVDLQLKSKHHEQILSRVRRNKTEHEDEIPLHEKAVKLVQKMNNQRKEHIDKKRKDVLILKKTVEESIRRFKQFEQQKQQQQLKKKQEIQKRIADRRIRAYEREKVNKVSDLIIRQLNSYKVSLPDIYTRSKNNEIQVTPLLLTGVDQQQIRTLQSKSDRGKAFLENIRLEDEQRVKQIQKRIEYQKHVRNMHLQYGKKQRLILKSREKKMSKSKKKL